MDRQAKPGRPRSRRRRPTARADTTETARQDDASDPSTASIKKNLTINHASRLTVTTADPSNDVDLFVLHDFNSDGQFTTDEIVAAATTGSSNEQVSLTRPPDGN